MIDIRYPIGLLFAIIGGLLIAYGLTTFSDPEIYRKSLDINVNLWAGSFMALFGMIMIALSRIGRER
jgi:hypothetical protein